MASEQALPVIVKIEFQRVQTFLFAVPRLADIVGANALLGEALRYELPQWAKQCGCSAPPDTYYKNLPNIAPSDDPLTKILEQPKDKIIPDFPRQQWQQGILARDGGHFQAYFADEAKADDFIKRARHGLREKLPSLRFSIEKQAIEEKTTDKAADTNNSNALFALPFLQQCQEAGNGVAVGNQHYTTKEKRAVGLPAKQCKDSWFRFKKNKTDDIAAIMARYLKLAKAETFDDLCKDHNKENTGDYLALIHADGNGLGKMLGELTKAYKKQDKDDNKGVDLHKEAEIETFFHTMRVTLRRALSEAITELYKEPLCSNLINSEVEKEGIQLLMLGGDDLLIACRAPLALPLVQLLAQALETLQENIDAKNRLTIGVGVAIAKPSFPFHRLHDLAEELAGSAKRLVRNNETPISVVDWAICSEAWHGDVSDVRKVTQVVKYTVNEHTETLALSAKPYRILGENSLKTLLENASELKKKSNTDTARSQLREIVRLMRKGRRQADFYYENLEIASKDTWDALQKVGFSDSLWRDLENGCYVSTFADLVEITEIDRLKTEKNRDKNIMAEEQSA